MAPKPISTVYFINIFHQSVYLHLYPPTVSRQRLGKKIYRGNEHTRNKRIVVHVVFYAVSLVSREGDYFFPELLVIKGTLSESLYRILE
jgi:hypothetical protein